MVDIINTKIKRLESILDLDTLQEGEVIEIKYKLFPYRPNNTIEVTGMYNINPLAQSSNRLLFLVPLENYGSPIILQYKIRKKNAQVEDGKLVMHQRVSKIVQFDQDMNLYRLFKEKLEKYTNLIK